MATPLAVLALVAAALLLDGGNQTAQPGKRVTPTTAADAMPMTFRGIKGGHLRSVDIATGTSTDLGPATTFSRAWVGQSTGSCRSRVTGGGGAFEVSGAVTSMALSPDGKTLAYARSQERPDAVLTEYPCGVESLVLRDVATGRERVWTGDEGYVESLSWKLDSKALALQTAVCCDADITIKAFLVSRPVGKVSDIPDAFPTNSSSSTKERYLNPVWEGETLTVLQEKDDATWQVVSGGIGTVLTTLPDQGVSLDQRGEWLLAALYGNSEVPGRLLALHKGDAPRELGTGFEQAHWG
jgi:hypothetical protein